MPDNKQLIERLRWARCLDPEAPKGERSILLNMAADTIERLEAERDKQARVVKEELGYAGEKRRRAEGECAGVRAKLAALEAQRERDAAVLGRYRTSFGGLCFQCAGSGEITGDFDQQESGGLKLCPECGGSGRKDALQHAQEQVGTAARCPNCGSDDPSVCLDTEVRKPKPGPLQPPSLGLPKVPTADGGWRPACPDPFHAQEQVER